jgi:predicted ATPase
MTYDPKMALSEVSGQLDQKLPGIMSIILKNIEFSVDSPARGLLESDRRIFEIVLALSKIEKPQNSTLCFDEYFDKDYKSTHQKVYKVLRALCEDQTMGLQVFIVTHSKSVLSHFGTKKVLVLKNGNIFYETHDGKHSGNSIILPYQLKEGMIA